MTNEINKLIWPSTNGIGVIDEAAPGPDGRDRPQHRERDRSDHHQ
ncbi:hypothetical protein [Nocardioides sp. B-3]|nr:hypothetical protein [Nocardioides sp. B-3]